jgi:hypothetical protein
MKNNEVGMKQDRFLLGILIFIGVLVIAAVGLFLVRNHAPAYGPEDTPQGVVYNYVIALRLKDYGRAYGYIAKKDNQPTFDQFQRAFLLPQLDPGTSSLQVGDVQILADGEAWVNLTIQYSGSGLFNNGYSNTDKAILVKQNGSWKITYLPYPYWDGAWDQPTPAPAPARP